MVTNHEPVFGETFGRAFRRGQETRAERVTSVSAGSGDPRRARSSTSN